MRSFEQFLRDFAIGEIVYEKSKHNIYCPMMLLCMAEGLDILSEDYPDAYDSHTRRYTLSETGRELYRKVLGEEPPRPYWEEETPPTEAPEASPEA